MRCNSECIQPQGNQCHCTDCHQTFRHVGDFEAHRFGSVNDRDCYDPNDMGLIDRAGIWASPESHERSRKLVDSRTAGRGNDGLEAA